MKKEKCFFYCILNRSVFVVATNRTGNTEHRFSELVELEKDETTPEAFDKWISLKSESLLKDLDPERLIGKTNLIDLYVIAE